MKNVFLIILFCFSLVSLYCEKDFINFSIGTIGGSVLSDTEHISGSINGSFIDLHFKTPIDNIGLSFSPLHYYAEFNSHNNSSNLNFSLINASLYYKLFKLHENTFVGPFSRIHWLDFDKNDLSFIAGMMFSARDELDLNFWGANVSYNKPLLFHYISIELGYLRRSEKNHVYLGASVDASFIGAVIVAAIFNRAEENTKKVAPDYKERL